MAKKLDWDEDEEVTVLDKDANLDEHIYLEVDVDGEMSKVNSLDERFNDLSDLQKQLLSLKGVTKSIASEAAILIPNFNNDIPLNRYSELPTQTHYRTALEEITTGMAAALAAAALAISALIIRFIGWLFSGSSSGGGGGGGGGRGRSPKKKTPTLDPSKVTPDEVKDLTTNKYDNEDEYLSSGIEYLKTILPLWLEFEKSFNDLNITIELNGNKGVIRNLTDFVDFLYENTDNKHDIKKIKYVTVLNPVLCFLKSRSIDLSKVKMSNVAKVLLSESKDIVVEDGLNGFRISELVLKHIDNVGNIEKYVTDKAESFSKILKKIEDIKNEKELKALAPIKEILNRNITSEQNFDNSVLSSLMTTINQNPELEATKLNEDIANLIKISKDNNLIPLAGRWDVFNITTGNRVLGNESTINDVVKVLTDGGKKILSCFAATDKITKISQLTFSISYFNDKINEIQELFKDRKDLPPQTMNIIKSINNSYTKDTRAIINILRALENQLTYINTVITNVQDAYFTAADTLGKLILKLASAEDKDKVKEAFRYFRELDEEFIKKNSKKFRV